uniref:Uncharacterized protein n=1 Tax=Siphoviridae sp. ctdj515 TaxID=2825582 RepID=A0A8S5UE94_9CAUD|nr:MAG TPA: hypothetical protein [Siphoviridae sp. ctdj515]
MSSVCPSSLSAPRARGRGDEQAPCCDHCGVSIGGGFTVSRRCERVHRKNAVT